MSVLPGLKRAAALLPGLRAAGCQAQSLASVAVSSAGQFAREERA